MFSSTANGNGWRDTRTSYPDSLPAPVARAGSSARACRWMGGLVPSASWERSEDLPPCPTELACRCRVCVRKPSFCFRQQSRLGNCRLRIAIRPSDPASSEKPFRACCASRIVAQVQRRDPCYDADGPAPGVGGARWIDDAVAVHCAQIACTRHWSSTPAYRAATCASAHSRCSRTNGSGSSGARVRRSTSAAVPTLPRTTAALRCNPQSLALHRRFTERRAERLLIQRQDVARQRHGVLPRTELPRRKTRTLRQLLRELHVPRTRLLGDVSV